MPKPFTAFAYPVASCLLALAGTHSALAADAFAPAAAQATLTVEMQFESVGKRQTKLDLFEWRGKRTASYSMPLVAGKPGAVSVLTGPDAAQQAQAKTAAGKAEKAAETMAPMMNSVMQIMERCREDEACITRETQKLGARMQRSRQAVRRSTRWCKPLNRARPATRPGNWATAFRAATRSMSSCTSCTPIPSA
jgi:hypothetical protein